MGEKSKCASFKCNRTILRVPASAASEERAPPTTDLLTCDDACHKLCRLGQCLSCGRMAADCHECASRRLKPVPRAMVLPFIGDSASLVQDGERLARKRMRQLGTVYESWMFGERIVSVARPDLVKWCLNNGEPGCMACAPLPPALSCPLHALAHNTISVPLQLCPRRCMPAEP